jgi:hypothetical protein
MNITFPGAKGEFRNGPLANSRKLSHGVPVAGKLEILSRTLVVNGFHLARSKSNPFLTGWTTADESASLPPRPDRRLVDTCRVAVKLEFEVDPLHVMRAARMGTSWLVIMDMKRRHGAEPTFAVEAVQCFQLGSGNR